MDGLFLLEESKKTGKTGKAFCGCTWSCYIIAGVKKTGNPMGVVNDLEESVIGDLSSTGLRLQN